MKKAKPAFDYETVVMGKNAELADDELAELTKKDVRLSRLLETLPTLSGNVLDIGCGGGTITNWLAFTYPRIKAFGCDISRAGIAIAKKTSRKRVSFGVIVKGKFPYPNKSMDACICFDVLEHVPDADQLLRETRRVLKKNGVVYFAIPCEGQPFSLTWFLIKMKLGHTLTNKHVGHIHPEFTHEYIRNLFAKHGFSIQSVTYSEHFLTQCIRFIRFIIPKELLEFVIGMQAEEYYDRSIVKDTNIAKKNPVIVFIRRMWMGFGRVFDFFENTDARILKFTGFTAWKMLLLAKSQ